MLCLKVLAINLLLILINPSSTAPDISNTNVYGAKGKSIELKVEKQPGGAKIVSIIWKHGKNKAAEWFEEDQEPPIKFGIFNTSSTSLVPDKWFLIISDLQSIFNGVYSAEVNNKDPTQSVTLTVIEAVSKPEVTKECIPESTNCTLTCKGTGDGPTQYSWNDEEWNGPVLTVLKSENQEVLYTCNFSNPVSWKTNSVSVPRTITTYESTKGGIIAAAVVIIFILLLVLAVAFLCKRNIVRPCWGQHRGYRINYEPANKDAQSGGDQSVVNMDEAGSSKGLTTNGQEPKEQNVEDESARKLHDGPRPTEGPTTNGPAQSGGDQSVVNMDEAGSSEDLTTNGQAKSEGEQQDKTAEHEPSEDQPTS
ncbi:CD48 antigen-like isoform X2 [Alosa sapidissima]|uniref:CD48 antigen-like isoform X2 n=1 Tax=Alosa sapidissima TaxID=34773 RepID=UPI001C0919DA|nr:CD48 antigen-like isoform X2 [Alosa sapidissima]